MAARSEADMSGYERRAWEALVEGARNPDENTGRYEAFAQTTRERIKKAAGRAGQTVRKLSRADQVIDGLDAAIKKAAAGLHVVFVERGLNSVSPAGIFSTFAREGVQISSYDEIRDLDLRICDQTMPRRKDRYLLLAAGQGAATSLAVTGATVSSTVSGGTTLGVAVAAVGADVTAVLVGMGRIVALVAAHYGYDVRQPEEQVFASGVLAYSTASSASEKAASLAALSRLTQEMMRRATWSQLTAHQIVRIIQRVVSGLGFNLTKRKLAQAVPVAGVGMNMGLNAWFAHSTFVRAQQAYRLRFLTEKYDLNPEAWTPDVVDAEVTDLPLVDEIVVAEIAHESEVGDDPAGELGSPPVPDAD